MLELIAVRNGNLQKLVEGREGDTNYGFSPFEWNADLENRIPFATLNFKGNAYVRYRLLSSKEMCNAKPLPPPIFNVLDEIFRSSKYLQYAYRASAAQVLPFGFRRIPKFEAVEIFRRREGTNREISRAQMPYHELALNKKNLYFRYRNSYRLPPLRGFELEFGRVIMAHPWPCKPDII